MIRIKNQNYTPPRLPAEYEEVEYIESTGTQYIDTGFMPNDNTSVEIHYKKEAWNKAWEAIYGSQGGGYGLLRDSSNNYIGVETNSGRLILTNYTGLGDITFKDDKRAIYYNGTNIGTRYTIANSPTSIYIFAKRKTSTTIDTTGNYKLYHFKIWDNDILVRNFVPCYRKSDNVTGLYDLVNNVFYTNKGTGTFLRGAEVYKEYVNLRPKIGNKNVISRYVGENLVYGGDLNQKVNYTMLYDYGDECEELTGGWRYYPVAGTGWSNFHNFTNYTFTKNADNLYLYGRGQSVLYDDVGAAITTNNIDTSDYNSVFVRSNYSTLGKNCVILAISFRYGELDLGGANKEGFGILFRTTGSSTALTANNPVYFKNKLKSNNIFGVYIESGGYAGSIGVYLRAFVLCKPDLWQPLASLAGISASSIADILTNSTTLLNNENAVKYMISHCTGDFMASAVSNQTFLTALNNSPYKTIIQGNEHWNKFLSMVA